MGIREDLSERYGDVLLFADGYDSAIIGVAIISIVNPPGKLTVIVPLV